MLRLDGSDVIGEDVDSASLLVLIVVDSPDKDNSSPIVLGCNTGGNRDMRTREDTVVGVVELGKIMLMVKTTIRRGSDL